MSTRMSARELAKTAELVNELGFGQDAEAIELTAEQRIRRERAAVLEDLVMTLRSEEWVLEEIQYLVETAFFAGASVEEEVIGLLTQAAPMGRSAYTIARQMEARTVARDIRVSTVVRCLKRLEQQGRVRPERIQGYRSYIWTLA